MKWLGFDWDESTSTTPRDYFPKLYDFAEELVRRGHAYVDSQSAEQMREARGTLTEPGTDSPYRDRDVSTNLLLLREMRDGKHMDGKHVLRAKIDMASPNINLRDPVMYRIRRAHAPPHRRRSGRSTPPTTGRTAPATRSSASRTPSARWSSRTTARSTTGSTSAWPRPACSSGRCRSRSSSPGST